MHCLAFGDLKSSLMSRIMKILESENLLQAEESAGNSSTLIHQAIMKAVCYSQQWARQISSQVVISSQSAAQQSTQSDPM